METRKYRRHRILRDYGLTPQKDFEDLYRMYDANDVNKLFGDIERFFGTPESKNFDTHYIILFHLITQNVVYN